MFFFEKKNQKADIEPGGAQESVSGQHVVFRLEWRQAQYGPFGSFFQK
jgi:hypothetical protein